MSDALGRTLTTTAGYGQPEASVATLAYTPDGQVATATDAKGNVTAYAYDGFDRAWRTCFQTASSAACAGSPGDYEQLTLDAGGLVTDRRLRDGQVLHYSYDALGRWTYTDLPDTNPAEKDLFATYDNLGRATGIGDTNGWNTVFGYDALGRKTVQSSNLASNSMSYDLAGRRTQQLFADGMYVAYDYDVLGEMTAVRENGATSGAQVLATYGYDDLGRRTSLARGNGTATTYGYDGSSRLTSLAQDLAGTAQDVTVTFGYNPANQIVVRTASNDAYAWTGAANVQRSYAANGLNQYTASGSVVPTYDARGNLTSAGGSATYTYNTRNQLSFNNQGQLFYHTPAGLLGQEAGVNLDYIDDRLTTEKTSGVDRRYVYGADDTPLVWYEGSGTSDRRWLYTDERGSVVAVANASTTLAINSYDEYGIPAAGNLGRFGYTGQKWIPELGLWDYKARMYSPSLGRFMQTDPIGYGDGMNWYDYVGGDPVNLSDPSGLGQCHGLLLHPGCQPNSKLSFTVITTAPTVTPPDPSSDITVTARWRGTDLSIGGSLGINFGAGLQTPALFLPPLVAGASPVQQQQNNQPQPCRPSPNAMKNSGGVTFKYSEFNVSALGTSGDAFGTFKTSNGYSGTFHTSFDGVFIGGKGVGVSYGGGSSRNLSTFSGVNYNVVATLGPYAISDNFDPNSGEHVGQTDAGSTLGLGVGGTRSNTTIVTTSCPR